MNDYRDGLCKACGDNTRMHRLAATCCRCYWILDGVRQSAAKRVRAAVRQGKLTPVKGLPCTDCGKPATDYDHRAYREPLSVTPTCRSCNLRRGHAIDLFDIIRERLAA